MINVNSYFSGAGLLDIGLIESGLNIVNAYELDSAACKTYIANIGNHIKQCDLTKELVLEQGDCDVMAFTYPCTKYSTIADIHSTRTGDELFLHALRHVAIKRPEAYVIENVPGMKAFPVVMEAMTKMPDYYVQVFCPVKAETWLPQRRNRLIIIATKRDFSIRTPENTKRIRLSEILEDEPRITLPKAIKIRMTGGYRDLPIISDPEKDDIAPTCVAHYAKDKSTRLVKDKRFPMGVRPYSVREFARLQGLPDWFQFPVSDTDAYKQIGNGVAVNMGRWIGTELTRYFGKLRLAA
jgi:DNA (cytosine-5)-methyltransferase 1